jgi:hypothetical protein
MGATIHFSSNNSGILYHFKFEGMLIRPLKGNIYQ